LVQVLIQTLGGLGIFIFGMNIMSEGLQQVAGERVRAILSAVSSNRFLAVATGTGVTALIQSSSATTVMLIGFVNAGLMSLTQAVGVILGANIGTTVTAQLIAFKITDLALPAIALGVGLKFFTRRRKHRYYGEVILGFGLLFFGLLTMKAGLAPIKHDPAFVAFFTRFAADDMAGVLLCVATGAVLTMIIQSSSATVGLTMTLAMQGLISFPGAVALVLGENIGTTITAQLATIGSGKNAHQAANAHTLFNVLGVIIIVLVFPYFVSVVEMLTAFIGSGPVDLAVGEEKPNVGRYIANAHTVFNVVSALVFTLGLTWLVKVATWITRHKEEPLEDLFQPPKLEERHTDNPPLALPQVRAEVIRMAQAAMTTLTDVVDCLSNRNLKKLSKWRKREDSLDMMQREISIYLTNIYQGTVTEGEAKEIRSLLRMSNNFERIGDAVENLALMIEELIENNLNMAPDAVGDIRAMTKRVQDFLELVTESIVIPIPELMDTAKAIESELDLMREEKRQGYIQRLRDGICIFDTSLIFLDMMSALEKMGDYCFNIAQAVAGEK
jgi:phosphate:Na+ symporter